MQAGLDSLGAVELRNAITLEFEVDIPATAAFDYPTISSLAAFIVSQLVPAGAVDLSTPQAAIAASQQLLEPAHMCTELVGMACIYPGSQSGGQKVSAITGLDQPWAPFTANGLQILGY